MATPRRSCQTMALCAGSPVFRSQTTAVSRWLAIPMAAISFAWTPALRMAARQVDATEGQIASGLCSTQPDAGKICANSFYATATTC